MPRWLEFHDSELLAVTAAPHAPHCTTIRPRGFVHQWEQQPTGWVGTGWTQHIRVRIEDPISDLPVFEPGVRIYDGTLECGSDAYRNMLRIPFSAATPCRLRLELADGGVLTVAGASVSLEPEGDSTYVERLSDDLRPDDAV